MKTRNLICLLTIQLVIPFVFMSCDSEDGDTTKPVINLIAPAEGAELIIGNEHGIHFDMEVSDNESLASYTVEIHSNFDDHQHSPGLRTSGETEAFAFKRTWESIKGKRNEKIHHHEIVIPANATPGKYHLMVYCADEAGNESYVARNVTLIHPNE